MRNLSLRYKLVMILLLPIVVLVYFAQLNLRIESSQIASLNEMYTGIVVQEIAAKLTHELQMERGLSALYVTPTAIVANEKERVRLNAQYRKVDQCLENFFKIAGNNVAMRNIVPSLSAFAKNRALLHQQIFDRAIAVEDVLSAYSDATSQLRQYPLDLAYFFAQQVHSQSGDSWISSHVVELLVMMNNYAIFSEMKDLAGVERALLGTMLRLKHVTVVEKEKLARIIEEQHRLGRLFLHTVEPTQLQIYQQKEFIYQQVLEGYAAEIQLYLKGDRELPLISAEEWFALATLRMDKLFEVEEELLLSMKVHGDNAMDALKGEKQLRIFFVLLTLLISVGFIWYLVEYLHRQVSQALHNIRRVAKGEFEMDGYPSSSDEMGQVLQAIDAMASQVAEAQQAIVAAENYATSITASMPECLFVLNIHGVITRVNKFACTHLGYKESEMVGKHINMLLEGAGAGSSFKDQILSVISNRLQFAYRADQQSFYDLLEYAPVSVMIVDKQGKVIFFNHRAEEIFGYSKDDMIGHSIDRLVPLAHRGSHDGNRHAFMKANQSKPMTLRSSLEGMRKNNQPVALQIGLLMMEMGHQDVVITIARCVAEDPDWSVIESTPFGALFEADDDRFKMVYLRDTKDQRIPMTLSAAPLMDGAAVLQGAVLIARDLSKKLQLLAEKSAAEKKLEEEQHQRLEALGGMASGVAHDFNNLLVPIMGNTENMLLEVDEHSKVHGQLQQVFQAAQQAARLSKQMLFYAGSSPFVLVQTHLDHLLAAMKPFLRDTMAGNIRLKMDLDSQTSAVDLDASAFEQVVFNVVTNSVEALASQGGMIRIRLFDQVVDAAYLKSPQTYAGDDSRKGEYVAVEIADNGHGMAEGVQKRLFDPFFTTKFTGRGLGMSVVLGIVYGHDGILHLQSQEGVGTTVTLSFPVSKQCPIENDTQGENREEKGDETMPSRHVLIIDDDGLVRMVMGSYLESMGYTFIEAADGQEGVDCYLSHQQEIDLVILDMTMPIMDGAACFKQLYAINPAIRVIISSGYAAENLYEQFPQDATVQYLPKPYTRIDVEKVLMAVECSDAE
ncbi:MAG: PAS domain S-box protein [Zetaproteobacteria bacterium]|nr:PAS domain S-box protein [Zetaproteobacteria bacterium]